MYHSLSALLYCSYKGALIHKGKAFPLFLCLLATSYSHNTPETKSWYNDKYTINVMKIDEMNPQDRLLPREIGECRRLRSVVELRG